MLFMAKFPNRIKVMRKTRKWTQTDLAEAMRPPTSKGQIYQLETGKRRLTQEWMYRIAEAIGCRPEELIVDAGSVQVAQVPVYSFDMASLEVALHDVAAKPQNHVFYKTTHAEVFGLSVPARAYAMNRIAVPGQVIIVDPKQRDVDALDGKPVIAHFRGERLFRRWFRNPDRLEPDSTESDYSTLFIPDFSDFRIIGKVVGVVSDFEKT